MGKRKREGAVEGACGPADEVADRRGFAHSNANPWVRDVLTVFLGLLSPADRVHNEAMGTPLGHRVPAARTVGQTTAPDPAATHVVDDKAMPWI